MFPFPFLSRLARLRVCRSFSQGAIPVLQPSLFFLTPLRSDDRTRNTRPPPLHPSPPVHHRRAPTPPHVRLVSSPNTAAANGHPGARPALPGEAAGDDASHGAPPLPRAPLGGECDRGHHGLLRLQPGGLPHHEPERGGPGAVPLVVLPDPQRPGEGGRGGGGENNATKKCSVWVVLGPFILFVCSFVASFIPKLPPACDMFLSCKFCRKVGVCRACPPSLGLGAVRARVMFPDACSKKEKEAFVVWKCVSCRGRVLFATMAGVAWRCVVGLSSRRLAFGGSLPVPSDLLV